MNAIHVAVFVTEVGIAILLGVLLQIWGWGFIGRRGRYRWRRLSGLAFGLFIMTAGIIWPMFGWGPLTLRGLGLL